MPFAKNVLACDNRPRSKLRVAVAPGLFAVGSQEIRKARLQIARDMPDDHRDRIPVAGTGFAKFVVMNLSQCAFAQDLVPAPFSFDRGNDVSHIVILPFRERKAIARRSAAPPSRHPASSRRTD